MDNLDGMHHHHHHIGGGASGGVGNSLCHPATPTVNSNHHPHHHAHAHLPDHAAVTVTVGGPSVMLHRNSSSSSTSSGMFSPTSSSSEINLNASAIVATASDCCSGNVMSFEETKQLLAKHLQETTRRCCGGVVSATTSSSSSSTATSSTPVTNESHNLPPAYAEDEANFDGIDLGGDDQTPVALGDILEKLQEETQLAKADDFIRLHGGVESSPATISATVNVATLDLSDPESIHRHLSQLNDTVLRVTTHEDTSMMQQPSSTMTTTASTTSAIESEFFDQHSNQDDGNQKQQSSPISISITNNSNVSVQTEELKSNEKTSGLTISTSSSNKKVLNRKSNSSSGGSKASPQSCSVCSKVFSNASALAKHRLTHSEERRYHCNICGKAFKRQDHLNGHLLTHRSTKPFACHVEGCGKSYCDARSLRRHKENHHGQAKPEKPASSSDNQSSENKSSNDSSTIMSGPDHLISKSNVLGDTKIKFSSKGLTAQQLQLIEQLFKQSKSKANLGQQQQASSSEKEKNAPLNANNIKKTGGSSSNSSSSLSADKQQLPDKPVECTICSRKFKNIPALNGHMRLHGGYYKKDAEGRRMVPGMQAQPLKTALNMAAANKRKVADQSTSPPQKKCLTVTYCPPPPQQQQQPQVTSGSMPSFAFSNLPQPDTSKLLANLEQKAKEMMTTSDTSTTCNSSTTSSLRALRKPTTNGSSTGSSTKKVPCCQQSEDPQQIATLINTQPLSLPLVALPTKPLPVQMTAVTTSQESSVVDQTSKTSSNCTLDMMNHVSSNSSTSIQITALIQSNPIINNTVVSSSNSTVHDFGVHNNHQDMMVNNMLSCMQQSINVHQNGHPQQQTMPQHHHHHYHHYGHHHNGHQSNTNLLKVDESTDKTPKIGDNHQATIPDLVQHLAMSELSEENEAPLWQPETAECLSEVELNQYLLLASSCVVGGGSHNEEVALEILQKHEGHVQNALQELLSSYDMTATEEDSLSLFSSQESDSEDDHCLVTPPPTSTKTKPWQPFEVDLFYEGLVRYHKDFNKVSKHVGSKSVKDCVEFYYLWKNICFEESQSFKSLFSQQQSLVNADQSNTCNSSNSMSEHVQNASVV